MNRLTLQNRKNQRIVGIFEKPETGPTLGTCIIQHGYGGTKDEEHIRACAATFRACGFQTFRFDSTNSVGESDGTYEEARLGLHYEDLVDVIAWAHTQDWFLKPLALIGHSMGGYTVARYAAEHPEEVALTCPIAPVVAGSLYKEAVEKYQPGMLAEWRKSGVRIRESNSRPGLMFRSPYAWFEELQNHDLRPLAHNIICPAFVVTGNEDRVCPPEAVEQLFRKIGSPKKIYHVLAGEGHTYSEKGLGEITHLLKEWLLAQK